MIIMPCLQENKWQYFIERLLEKKLQITDAEQTFLADGTPQKSVVVNDSIKIITLYKNAYKKLYNAVADCLRQSFNSMDKKHLKKLIKFYD